MKCVICKTGEVRPAFVQAEVKVGGDRLLVPVEAEVCQECGERYFHATTLDALDQLLKGREAFSFFRSRISYPRNFPRIHPYESEAFAFIDELDQLHR